MTITSIDDLYTWFKNLQRADDTPTHWSLYSNEPGKVDTKATTNTRYDEFDASWDVLEKSIRMLNNPKGTRMRLQIFPKGKANNYTAQVHVQIYQDGTVGAPGENHGQGAHSGIGMLPAGMGSLDSYVQQRIDLELLRRENEDLKDAINGPNNMWERLVQTVADSPHLSQVVNNLVVGLVSKVNPAAMPHMQTTPPPTPMNGHPATDGAEDENPDVVFSNNIHAASAVLGTDPLTLAIKLNALVQNQPELAKQILNS